MRILSIAVLMTATVAVPAALAQSDQNQTAATEGACQDLVAFVDRNNTDKTGITADRAQRIADKGDLQTCHAALRMARGEISRIEGEENYDADATARLRVYVPEPQVTVQQPAPEVQVDQRAPQVAVNPGQPVVTVNQAEPVVRVQTTPPKITIDMPKPEILVEMPDPTVDVAMRQPRVTVNQPEPEVRVEQGEVSVELREGQRQAAEDSDQAQVDVQREEQATVQVGKTDEAQVQIEDVQPQVRYNAAKPRIEVQETGEPQIAFNQSGEANVRFRQMTAEQTRATSEESQDAATAYRADAREPEVGERTEAVDESADRQDTAEQSQTAVTQDQAGRQPDAARSPAAESADRQDTAEQSQAAVTQDQADRQQDAAQSAAADTQQTGQQDVTRQGDQQAAAGDAQPARDDTGYSVVDPQQTADADQTGATENIRVSRLRDMEVIGAGGESIGGVKEVVLRGDETYIIVGSGGFLGLGEKEVALPLSDMTIRGDQLIMRQLTEAEIDDMQEFDRTEFQPSDPNQSMRVRSE